MIVALLDNEGDENAIIRRASDAVGAFGCQKLRPGLWGRQVGVIDIKEGQHSPGAGPESIEGTVFSIPEKNNIADLNTKSAECFIVTSKVTEFLMAGLKV